MKTFILILLLIKNSYALKLANVEIADKITLAEQELVLNGAGIRKATWLKVKVYVGSLYLSKQSNDVSTILNQKGPKILRMHFVRSVGKDKLNNGWQEAFERSLNKNELVKYQPSIDQFKNSIQDMNKNDAIELTFHDDKLEYKIKGEKQPLITQKGFSKRLLSVWFINAEDEGLKRGLLGI